LNVAERSAVNRQSREMSEGVAREGAADLV
jgi:hypothetical protein